MKVSVFTSLSLVLTLAFANQALAADTKADAKPEAKVVSKEKSDKERLETLKELAHKHKFRDKTESTGDLEIKLQKHLNKLIKEMKIIHVLDDLFYFFEFIKFESN